MLHADPEGFVPGTVPGLAVAANVNIDETRAAVEKFMAPDPDSNTPDHEGRRLEKVAHGWRILNFEYWRLLAQHEAEKARKRRWASAKRGKQLQLPFPPEFLESESTDDVASTVDASSETLDASKSISKSKSLSSSSSTGEPLVIHSWPEGLELSEEFIAKAKMAGVVDPQKWFDRLKQGPIGGTRGVLVHKLVDYLDDQIGKWRTWEETDRAKDAQRSAAAASPRRFGESALPVDPFEPDMSQRAFAAKHGLDLDGLLKGALADHPQRSQSLSRLGVLSERLTVAAKQKRAGRPVTGKLTRDEAAMWGPVPPGGAIPEVA
jgi:hypothetical protein